MLLDRFTCHSYNVQNTVVKIPVLYIIQVNRFLVKILLLISLALYLQPGYFCKYKQKIPVLYIIQVNRFLVKILLLISLALYLQPGYFCKYKQMLITRKS